MCFVIFSFPSVSSGYLCETLVIFVLVVEVGFVSWFSVEAIEVAVHLFEEQALFLVFFRYWSAHPISYHIPDGKWCLRAEKQKAVNPPLIVPLKSFEIISRVVTLNWIVSLNYSQSWNT